MRNVFRLGIFLTALAASAPAFGQADNPSREASRHFQRGVELYNDGDFRGALVEFKKAYSVQPRANVLYDIGETQYQLQDYASALGTFERFLAETGSNAPHRNEVHETIQVLKNRVGRIALVSERNNCEVAIDDQPAGTTPLIQPLVVSVGPRRVALSCAGQPPAVRRVEVSAGETLTVEIKLAPPAPPPLAPAAAVPLNTSAVDRAAARHHVITGWTITGVLAAGTIAMYTFAWLENRDLEDLRNMYPVSHDSLSQKSDMTSRLALVGDALAGATLVAAGISAYLMLDSREEQKLQVGVAWNGVALRGTF